jgi:thioredoxin 1
MANPKMINKPLSINDSIFDTTIKNHEFVVIDCWAPWCGPCRMLAPIIDELAEAYKGKIVFAKLNTDENQDTAAKYGIMSIPTLLLFKNGQLIDRIVGAMPRADLDAKLKEIYNL